MPGVERREGPLTQKPTIPSQESGPFASGPKTPTGSPSKTTTSTSSNPKKTKLKPYSRAVPNSRSSAGPLAGQCASPRVDPPYGCGAPRTAFKEPMLRHSTALRTSSQPLVPTSSVQRSSGARTTAPTESAPPAPAAPAASRSCTSSMTSGRSPPPRARRAPGPRWA